MLPLLMSIAKVGPRIEFSQGSVFEDEDIAKILPFLALPDGAHLVYHQFCAQLQDLNMSFRMPKTTLISILFLSLQIRQLFSASRK
jgi:hypothetical protein